jgi:hypothetical protein
VQWEHWFPDRNRSFYLSDAAHIDAVRHAIACQTMRILAFRDPMRAPDL